MLLQKVKDAIRDNQLLDSGERVMIAYSGGPDSTCLLLLMREIDPHCSAVYVNHNLRGAESAQEEDFVRAFCAERNIPLHVEQIHWRIQPSNLEEAARKRRYRHLRKVAAQMDHQKIALAHHQDDQVETFLMRLLRGSGPPGLSGLQWKRGPYIRPLLGCSKQEILQWLHENEVPYFTDSSNKATIFLRNDIRNNLIPYLETRFNPSVKKAILRARNWIDEENRFVNELMAPYKTLIRRENDEQVISRKDFEKSSYLLQKALLRQLLAQTDSFFAPSSRMLEKMHRAAVQKEKLELPGFLVLKSTSEYIRLGRKTGRIGYHEVDVPHPGSYYFPPGNAHLVFTLTENSGFQKSSDSAFLDADKVPFPLYIRNWRKGDSFRPLGMKGRKKLSDFFIDKKIKREKRTQIPLVFKDDEIIWVAGLQIHDEYRVRESTKRILKIELK